MLIATADSLPCLIGKRFELPTTTWFHSMNYMESCSNNCAVLSFDKEVWRIRFSRLDVCSHPVTVFGDGLPNSSNNWQAKSADDLCVVWGGHFDSQYVPHCIVSTPFITKMHTCPQLWENLLKMYKATAKAKYGFSPHHDFLTLKVCLGCSRETCCKL